MDLNIVYKNRLLDTINYMINLESFVIDGENVPVAGR